MLVTLGEKGVKTLEDFAGLVGDDIRGYFETKNGERVREPGILEDYQLTSEQADQLVLNARVAAGWIEAPPEPEHEPRSRRRRRRCRQRLPEIEAEGPRRERERRCIVSGEHDSGANLIRFALSPDGVVTPDVAAKLPGRGAWVRADRAILEQAVEKGRLRARIQNAGYSSRWLGRQR